MKFILFSFRCFEIGLTTKSWQVNKLIKRLVVHSYSKHLPLKSLQLIDSEYVVEHALALL